MMRTALEQRSAGSGKRSIGKADGVSFVRQEGPREYCLSDRLRLKLGLGLEKRMVAANAV
jgi:hypothetical protein